MYLYVFNFKEPVPVDCTSDWIEIQLILRLLQPLQYLHWDSLQVQQWNWGYSSISTGNRNLNLDWTGSILGVKTFLPGIHRSQIHSWQSSTGKRVGNREDHLLVNIERWFIEESSTWWHIEWWNSSPDNSLIAVEEGEFVAIQNGSYIIGNSQCSIW